MEPGPQFIQIKRTTFRIEPGTFPRTVRAYHDGTGKQVGHLGWDSDQDHVPERQRNAVSNVDVLSAYRRRGLATAMFEYGRQMNPDLRHSPTLTEDGQKFVEGGPK